MLSLIAYIVMYTIKQRLIDEKVNIKTIIYVLTFAFYTKPLIAKVVSDKGLLNDINLCIDWIVMLFIFL